VKLSTLCGFFSGKKRRSVPFTTQFFLAEPFFEIAFDSLVASGLTLCCSLSKTNTQELANMRWKSAGIFIFSVAFITGCTTIPPKEVHSADGISRDTIVDSTPLGQTPKRFALGGGMSRGVGNQDVGKENDSTNVEVTGELRVVEKFAIGLQPFFSFSDGVFDSDTNFGITLYGRWKFLELNRWAFSLYPGIGYAKNSAQSNGQVCGIFGCVDDGQTSESHSEIIDPRLGLITSYYFNDKNVLSVIPTLYYSHESGSYSLAGVQQFAGSKTGLEYSAVLAYGYFFETGGQQTMIQFSAGAGTHRGFGAYGADQHISPLVQLGVQFALGKEVQ
jgi:hypothetical protein